MKTALNRPNIKNAAPSANRLAFMSAFSRYAGASERAVMRTTIASAMTARAQSSMRHEKRYFPRTTSCFATGRRAENARSFASRASSKLWKMAHYLPKLAGWKMPRATKKDPQRTGYPGREDISPKATKKYESGDALNFISLFIMLRIVLIYCSPLPMRRNARSSVKAGYVFVRFRTVATPKSSPLTSMIFHEQHVAWLSPAPPTRNGIFCKLLLCLVACSRLPRFDPRTMSGIIQQMPWHIALRPGRSSGRRAAARCQDRWRGRAGRLPKCRESDSCRLHAAAQRAASSCSGTPGRRRGRRSPT
jgi:hypothetical protein